MTAAPTDLSRQGWVAEPSPALRPWVKGYVAQAIDVPPGQLATLTIAATVYPVLTVTYAGTVLSDRDRTDEAPVPQVSMTGPIPAAFRPTFGGRPRGFFVQLEPAAPLALLGLRGADHRPDLPLSRLVRPEVADRLDAWARDVAAAGDEEAALAERAARTERLLQALLGLEALAPARARAAETARMAAHIVGADGTRPVTEVAAGLEISPRTLRRRFQADLGIAPKPFSAVVRFRHALAYLRAHPGTSWARVAARFGYADQSHFIRDYKRFAGVVPTRWDDAERFIDLTFGLLEEGGG